MLAWFFLLMCFTDIFVAQYKQGGAQMMLVAIVATAANAVSFWLTRIMRKSAGSANPVHDFVIATHFLTSIFAILFFIYMMVFAKPILAGL